jgi:AcrR family transcriptional regulator
LADGADALSLDWRVDHQLSMTPILSHALEAFYEQGFEATSVRDIARRVQVTVPAIYYHHENKEAVLFELLDRSIDRIIALCTAAVEAAGEDVVERFLNLVRGLALYETQARKLAVLDGEIRSLNAEHTLAYLAKRRRVETIMRDAIDGGVRAGVFDVINTWMTARAILGMLQALANWYTPDGGHSATEVASGYVEIAARTVGIRPDELRRTAHYSTSLPSRPRTTQTCQRSSTPAWPSPWKSATGPGAPGYPSACRSPMRRTSSAAQPSPLPWAPPGTLRVRLEARASRG